MKKSCLCTMLYAGRTFTALAHAECTASYSACVSVNSSGSSTRYATVMSASLLMMQPFSTESNGNLLSSVAAFITFLIHFVFLRLLKTAGGNSCG